MAVNVDISKITGINQVGNSYQRKSAVPLDYYSLFNTKTEAETYAASNPVSYVGQVISYIHEGKVKVCVIADAAGTLKEVGTAPLGDGKTIEVSAAGAISLLGAAAAENGTLPMIEEVEENGQKVSKLVWKTLEDIGAGDGNDNTTYKFAFGDQKITITPVHNGVDQAEQVLDLTGFITSEELAEAIAALPEDKDTTYTAKADDKVLTLSGTEFSTELGLKHENGKISLTGKGGEVIAEFSDADFIQDGFLTSVDLVDENPDLEGDDKTVGAPFLKFVWNTSSSLVPNTTYVAIGELVDVYTAGNGLELIANKFSIKVAEGNESFLTVDENGIKLSGVQSAIDTALQDAKDYTDGKEHKNTTYDISSNGVSITLTPSEGEAKTVSVDAYTKSETDTKIDEKIASVTGGESAADVKLALESYRDAINAEMWGEDAKNWTVTTTEDGKTKVTYTPQYGAESRLDRLEKVGAQANVIEEVKVDNGDAEATQPHKLTATLSGKTVTLNDTALQTAIADAKKAGTDAAQSASEAKATASENAGKIQVNINDITNLKTASGEHATKIANLEAADTAHNALYESLRNTVEGHTGAIAGKAEQSSLDAVSQKASVNEQAIKTLNETTIPGINGEIAKKANADAVYTKEQIGTIPENKTIVQMIADAQAAASYDDTKVKEDIAANTAAIENITKEGGTIAVAVKAEADRAKGAEQSLADDIAEINALLNTVDSEDTITSLKELAIWVEEHGGEASRMAESIQANADAIELINDAENGILVQAKAHSDANLAAANAYADAIEAKIPGVDDKTIKLAENKVYVAEVSTDVLVQGAQELVLCGGNANGFASNS